MCGGIFIHHFKFSSFCCKFAAEYASETIFLKSVNICRSYDENLVIYFWTTHTRRFKRPFSRCTRVSRLL